MTGTLHNIAATIYTGVHRLRTGGTYHLRYGNLSATFANRSPWMQDRLELQEQKECPVIQDLLGHLRTEDTFWDVGAAYGLYSCLIGVVKPEVTVVAFEPHPDHTSLIRDNLSTNGVEAMVYNAALGAESRTVAYQFDTEQTIGNPAGDTEAVSMKRGDALVSEGCVPLPDVVKIDVEGAELDVLTGMENTLNTSTRTVYCETHPEKSMLDQPTEQVSGWLTEHGYDVGTVEAGAGEEPLLRGTK